MRKDTWPVWASPCLALSLWFCHLSGAGLGLFLGSSWLWSTVVLLFPDLILGQEKSAHFCCLQHALVTGFSREATRQKPQPMLERGSFWSLGDISDSLSLPIPKNSISQPALQPSEATWHGSGERNIKWKSPEAVSSLSNLFLFGTWAWSANCKDTNYFEDDGAERWKESGLLMALLRRREATTGLGCLPLDFLSSERNNSPSFFGLKPPYLGFLIYVTTCIPDTLS